MEKIQSSKVEKINAIIAHTGLYLPCTARADLNYFIKTSTVHIGKHSSDVTHSQYRKYERCTSMFNS